MNKRIIHLVSWRLLAGTTCFSYTDRAATAQVQKISEDEKASFKMKSWQQKKTE